MRRVYIISDLHLGGADSARLMTHPEVLARFIERRAAEPGEVELVINGDFVDFLAEEHAEGPRWRPFVAEPDLAVATLRRIMRRPGEAAVFAALRRFVAKGRLTILLGNHDLELSLPAVRRALAEELEAPAGALGFLYDGEAYRVGDALIEHGNRYDPYNEVDHDGLRRLRSLQSRGQDLAAAKFAAPAGSRFVCEFVNPIKAEGLRFIDRLKPEGAALIALLLAIDPTQRRRLGALLQARWAIRGHGPFAEDAALPRRQGAISGRRRPPKDPGDLLVHLGVWTQAEREAATGWLPRTGGEISAQRGMGQVLKLAAYGAWLDEPARLAHVQRALAHCLDPDLAFHEAVETQEGYLAAAERLIDEGARWVVFGHTHHAKVVPFPHGTYLNSGTWADVMGYPAELLAEDPTISAPAWARFARALAADDLEGYLDFAPTAVRLELEGARVTDGRLVEGGA